MKKILSLLIVLILMMSVATPVLAAGSVTYDGTANEFIFAPGSKDSETNLFGDFQNVMPGDKLTEQITIENDSSRRVKIRVYLRSLGAQENTDEFLSQMKLTVKEKDGSVLFAAPADETADLTNWVYLGTVYSGGKITLDVTLEVPITMGNEFRNKVGYIDWEFKVEELPVEPSDPLPPQTGDTSGIFLYAGLMIVSLIALILLLTALKRKREE